MKLKCGKLYLTLLSLHLIRGCGQLVALDDSALEVPLGVDGVGRRQD